MSGSRMKRDGEGYCTKRAALMKEMKVKENRRESKQARRSLKSRYIQLLVRVDRNIGQGLHGLVASQVSKKKSCRASDAPSVVGVDQLLLAVSKQENIGWLPLTRQSSSFLLNFLMAVLSNAVSGMAPASFDS